jgi:hypothetical protein
MKVRYHIPIKKNKINIKKKLKLFIKIYKTSYYEYFIIFIVGIGVFLPVRLIYYNYVSKFFGFNLGILTIIAIIMYILVKKKKLGKLGDIFERRAIRLTGKTITKLAILSSFIYIIFYGGNLYIINIVDFDKEPYTELAMYRSFTTHITFQQKALSQSGLWNPYDVSLFFIDNPDIQAKKFSILDPNIQLKELIIIFYVINKASGDWYSHFNALMFAEELEGFGLFFFDKRMYRRGLVKGQSWKEIGLFTNWNNSKRLKL